MFGCRTAIGVGCFALVLCVAYGCGGAVERDGATVAGAGQAGSGTAGRAGDSGKAGASGAGHAGAAGASGSGAQGGSGIVDPKPVDAGCPIQDPPPPDLQCDPLGVNTCGVGAGCYPFVDHPEGSGCDQQRYGTICLPAGQGTQGALCGDETGDFCAPGFVCVIGQRAGKRCAALCDLNGSNQCTGGLICGDLDVAGFGVCG